MGHHVALQKGWGTEHFSTGGARMVLSGVDFVDMFAVLLQGSKAHPALFAVIGIFYVWCPGIQQKYRRQSKEKRN